MLRFSRWIAAVGLLLLPACLPDTLSDDALHAAVLDATASKGGPLCGNAVIDPAEGETCDDGNTDSCDSCDKCQVRTALDCKDGKSLVGLTTLGALQFDGQQDWSVEAWFLVRSAPQKLPAPFVIIGVPGAKTGASTAFTMGIAPVSGNLVTFCAIEKINKSTSIGASVAPNTWHHLRCVWNAKDGDIHASVDGGGLGTADKKLANKGGGFEATSWLLAGQLPAADTGVLQVEPFDGLLDELRAAVGPNVSTTPLLRRYGTADAETVALYHMDPDAQVRVLKDATNNHLDADQITLQTATTPVKRDAVLTFAPEACYGYSAANAECQANPKPPWCP